MRGELEPHLSLMRFTYCQGLDDPESEVMVISTQRKTRKYDLLTACPNVALLVHCRLITSHAAWQINTYGTAQGGAASIHPRVRPRAMRDHE